MNVNCKLPFCKIQAKFCPVRQAHVYVWGCVCEGVCVSSVGFNDRCVFYERAGYVHLSFMAEIFSVV